MKICSDSLIPIEENFRISAGPGAGKTYWLAKHIKNILQNSTRLSPARKVACITYTNIGVESILKQIGSNSSQVEVSTIHSFLYRYVLKPYCTFISDEYELSVEELDGHDEAFVDYKKVNQWLRRHPRVDEFKHPYSLKQLTQMAENRVALGKWLSSLRYKFDAHGNLYITGDRTKAFSGQGAERRGLRRECLDILESDLWGYKKLYWREGIIDHDDVLFFSYQLINKHPFILTAIRAQFPYFFIDEFQDSSPIQVELVKRIGEEETVVGIIGDKAQSIYEFQDAVPEQFSEFLLPDLREYTIEKNRRSTNNIIDVLNHIREDIYQEGHRNIQGDKPLIIIGDCNKAYNLVKDICRDQTVDCLYRRNDLANTMKEEFEDAKISRNILEQFTREDSNHIRRLKILSCIQAVELARCEQYEQAMKKLKFLRSDRKSELEDRKRIIKSLYILLNHYDLYKDKPLMDFYNLVKERVDSSLSGFRKGSKPGQFYIANKYGELAMYARWEDDVSCHKTIHKSKGDEFENVMLTLTDEKYLDFLLQSDLANNEEHRVYYVAVSRAKDRLFVNVPSLSHDNAARLKDLFEIRSI